MIGLGLGLAVDYSLLLVWRFREELSARRRRPGARSRRRCEPPGRTIVFSAATVTAAMLTLTLFPQRFLISMGIGGAATALVSCAAALLAMPALLVLLAGRIGRVKPAPEGTGRWYRLAQVVMRRPALVAAGTTLVLLVIASPTLHVRWAGVDATDLPSRAERARRLRRARPRVRRPGAQPDHDRRARARLGGAAARRLRAAADGRCRA